MVETLPFEDVLPAPQPDNEINIKTVDKKSAVIFLFVIFTLFTSLLSFVNVYIFFTVTTISCCPLFVKYVLRFLQKDFANGMIESKEKLEGVMELLWQILGMENLTIHSMQC